MQNTLMAAHQASNKRVPTDLYLLPDSEEFNMLDSIKEEIEARKKLQNYIEVTDEEIAINRFYSDNTDTIGQTMAEILVEKSRGPYKGLTNDGGEDWEESFEKGLQASAEGSTMNSEVEEEVTNKVVIDIALYSHQDKTTVYFLKNI